MGYPERTRYWLLVLMLILLAVVPVTAQHSDTFFLTLTSADPAHPVYMQWLSPGGTPTASGFSSRLDYAADPATEQTVAYLALKNTGWSTGVVGLAGEALTAEVQYVALEVDADYAPLDGGLAFALEHTEHAEGDAEFQLPVLIARTRTLGIFRVVENDGLAFTGYTNTRENGIVSQDAITFTVDPDPVIAPVVLEFHIVAQQPVTAGGTTTPGAAAPSAVETPAASSGTWGGCGSCDSCGMGHPGECVLSPDGACLWDPGRCAVVVPAGGNSDQALTSDPGNNETTQEPLTPVVLPTLTPSLPPRPTSIN